MGFDEGLQVRWHGRLEPANAGDVLVSIGMGFDSRAWALWSTPSGRDALTSSTVSPGGATFPDAQTAAPVTARVTVHDPDLVGLISIDTLSIAGPHVQPLPEGRVLLVGSRCRWRPDGPDENAAIYDSNGELLVAATLGDGIEQVQTTEAGQVWVGYFDEGVFGNYGWGNPGPEPVGSHGIVRFSPDLTVEWEYPYDADSGPVDDCYAMNVDGDATWACYYSDFPVIRIRGDEIEAWHNDHVGARALVTADSKIALAGGYGADHALVVWGDLEGGRVTMRNRRRLLRPDGERLPPAVLTGRGSILNAFVEDEWYVLDFAALIS